MSCPYNRWLGRSVFFKILLCKKRKFERDYKQLYFRLLGYFYGSITKLLGFKPHQHEGKILGLAAFGNGSKAYKDIAKMISFDKEKIVSKETMKKGCI